MSLIRYHKNVLAKQFSGFAVQFVCKEMVVHFNQVYITLKYIVLEIFICEEPLYIYTTPH